MGVLIGGEYGIKFRFSFHSLLGLGLGLYSGVLKDYPWDLRDHMWCQGLSLGLLCARQVPYLVYIFPVPSVQLFNFSSGWKLVSLWDLILIGRLLQEFQRGKKLSKEGGRAGMEVNYLGSLETRTCPHIQAVWSWS